MSQGKHSPGPWRRDRQYDQRYREAGGYCIYGPPHPVDGGNYAPIAVAHSDADANLICAAPELLAALQNAYQFITNGIGLGYIRMPDPDTPDPAHQTPDAIRAAIAKAKGETI